ncbi:MAG: peptide ABC transporter substrate-binding protein [Alphaproteobacteria bacterium]|nr:peptide ABC transporter substrate-binding protein [Alphaproteobacteria bacterium]
MIKQLSGFKALLLAAAFAVAGITNAGAEQVLNRGNGTEPETLDPHLSTGVPEANIIYDLFEGLLTRSADGQPVPGIAEKWEISNDGKVYTFHLRKNAKWSNGDPITSDDFVYSLRRLVDPKTNADYAWFADPILNAEDIRTGKNTDISQLGVKTVDPQTLQITLKASAPHFIAMLVHHSLWPVHKATVEKFGAQWTKPGNMVSSGAYMLTEWTPQSKVVLKKNPNFHDAANVKIDVVNYFPTENQAEEFKRYKAGELDITYDVPMDQISVAQQTMKNEYQNTPYFGTYYYGINMEKDPLGKEPTVRKALALAVDRDVIVKQITKGGQIPAYAFVPPGIPGYEQQNADFASMTQAQREEMAKKLFAEAGYGASKPLKVEILYNTSDQHKNIAVAIQAMWKKVLGNIETTLTNQEWKVYLDTRDKKQYQVARAAWIGDFKDASNFLDMFRSNAGQANNIGYNNAKYDELLTKAGVTSDQKERFGLLQQAEKTLISDLPIIPIYHYTDDHMVNPKIQGWKNDLLGFHLTRYLSKQ